MFKEEFIQKMLDYPIDKFLESSFFHSLKDLEEIYKIDCYFDCDGVLLDTITVSFKEMNASLKEKGIVLFPNRNNSKEGEKFIAKYYKNINWLDLIKRSGEIDQSFKKLKIIKEANLFKNVGIATHRHSFLNEGEAKKEIIQQETNVTVFSIPIKIAKSTALKSQGNILVDDSKAKIEDWVSHEGIGILFIQKQENEPDYLLPPTLETPYYITNNILNVLKIPYLKHFIQISHKPFVKKI